MLFPILLAVVVATIVAVKIYQSKKPKQFIVGEQPSVDFHWNEEVSIAELAPEATPEPTIVEAITEKVTKKEINKKSTGNKKSPAKMSAKKPVKKSTKK